MHPPGLSLGCIENKRPLEGGGAVLSVEFIQDQLNSKK